MARKSYFVDPGPLRSNNLKMEIELAHILIGDIKHAVLNEDAVKDYVEDLKAAQDSISRQNPKLRRVEIKADLTRGAGYPGIGLACFIIIGDYHCPLYEVTKIV